MKIRMSIQVTAVHLYNSPTTIFRYCCCCWSRHQDRRHPRAHLELRFGAHSSRPRRPPNSTRSRASDDAPQHRCSWTIAVQLLKTMLMLMCSVEVVVDVVGGGVVERRKTRTRSTSRSQSRCCCWDRSLLLKPTNPLQ